MTLLASGNNTTSAEEPSSITLAQYFCQSIPCRMAGIVTENQYFGTDPLHLLLPQPCAVGPCSALASIISISTTWPDILQVIPTTTGLSISPPNSHTPVHFERYWSLPSVLPSSLSDDFSTVGYSLAGRLLYHSNSQHYTAQIVIGDYTYTYNDLEKGRRLQNIGLSDQCSIPNLEAVLYIYARTSHFQVSIQILAYYPNSNNC